MFSERFTKLTSDIGSLYILADAKRVIRIGLQKPPSMGILRCDSAPLLKKVCRELEEYFEGTRKEFEFSAETAFSPFAKAVFECTTKIPYGTIYHSKQLAEEAGYPFSQRAVEQLCINNPLYICIPTHRVLCQCDYPNAVIDESIRRMEQRYLQS